MAQIEVTNVTVNDKFIIIEGVDLDRIILAEDLYQDIDIEEISRYEFDRTKSGAMKYLYKVVTTTKVCKSSKSFGAKLDKLVGSFIILSDNFKVAA